MPGPRVQLPTRSAPDGSLDAGRNENRTSGAEFDQHPRLRGVVKEQPVGHGVQRPAGAALCQISRRKGVDHVQAGQVRQSAGVDQRDITDEPAPASSPNARLSNADCQHPPFALRPAGRTNHPRRRRQLRLTRRLAMPQNPWESGASGRPRGEAAWAHPGPRAQRSRRAPRTRDPYRRPARPAPAGPIARPPGRRRSGSGQISAASVAKDVLASRNVGPLKTGFLGRYVDFIGKTCPASDHFEYHPPRKWPVRGSAKMAPRTLYFHSPSGRNGRVFIRKALSSSGLCA